MDELHSNVSLWERLQTGMQPSIHPNTQPTKTAREHDTHLTSSREDGLDKTTQSNMENMRLCHDGLHAYGLLFHHSQDPIVLIRTPPVERSRNATSYCTSAYARAQTRCGRVAQLHNRLAIPRPHRF